MGAKKLHTHPQFYHFKKVMKGGIFSQEKTGSEKYRFGFNGKEKVNEQYGEGNMYDYGFRIYDPRIGRFLSTDPLFKEYPWFTPYQFAANMPIACSDVDGMEGKLEIYGEDGQVIKTVTFDNPGILGAGTLAVYLHGDGKGDNVYYGEVVDGEYKILKSWHMDVSIDNVADYKTWLNVTEFIKKDNSAVQKNVATSSANNMESPIEHPVVTSDVGLRTDPISGATNSSHPGTDVVPGNIPKGQRDGTPIVSPVDGKVLSVKFATDGNGAGNRVHIIDKQGNKHSFFHMLDNSIRVQAGKPIQKGDTIGGMGNTGYSKGTHLHYEMHDKAGNLLDPAQANDGFKKAIQDEKTHKH